MKHQLLKDIKELFKSITPSDLKAIQPQSGYVKKKSINVSCESEKFLITLNINAEQFQRLLKDRWCSVMQTIYRKFNPIEFIATRIGQPDNGRDYFDGHITEVHGVPTCVDVAYNASDNAYEVTVYVFFQT